MPFLVYKKNPHNLLRDYEQDEMVGVCNDKEIHTVIHKLEKETMIRDDDPVMVDLVSQKNVIKGKMAELNKDRMKIDYGAADPSLRPLISQLNLGLITKLANAELERKLVDLNKKMSEVDQKIERAKDIKGMFYHRYVSKLK